MLTHGMHTLQELVKEGLIKGIGLSEISAADIRKAHAVFPITAVEMEWSLFSRDAEVHRLSQHSMSSALADVSVSQPLIQYHD